MQPNSSSLNPSVARHCNAAYISLLCVAAIANSRTDNPGMRVCKDVQIAETSRLHNCSSDD